MISWLHYRPACRVTEAYVIEKGSVRHLGLDRPRVSMTRTGSGWPEQRQNFLKVSRLALQIGHSSGGVPSMVYPHTGQM